MSTRRPISGVFHALRDFLPEGFSTFTPKGSTPNKYRPHQGKQECARRLSQRLRNHWRQIAKDEKAVKRQDEELLACINEALGG